MPMRPDLMVVTPVEAAPGQTVQLTFPTSRDRGLGFGLERSTSEGWVQEFDMWSDRSGGTPGWQRVGGEVLIDLVGIRGPGPDTVVIPDIAEPGEWRICTLFNLQGFCAPLTIVPAE